MAHNQNNKPTYDGIYNFKTIISVGGPIALLIVADFFNKHRMFFALIVSVLLCTYGLVIGYKRNGKVRNRLKKSYDEYVSEQQTILSRGKDGEVLVENAIQHLRTSMTFLSHEHTWMPSDSGIHEIVLLMGERTASKELDSLIVHKDFVFVIEVKTWKGQITQRNGIMYQDGKEIKSPHKQTQEKVRVIEECLSSLNLNAEHHCKVVPVYVFPHTLTVLDPNLPFNYITLAALPSFIIYYRDLYMKKASQLTVKQISEVLLAKMSREEQPKYQHLLRLANYTSNPSEEVKRFKVLHEAKLVKQAEIENIPIDFVSNLKNALMYGTVAAIVPVGLFLYLM